MTAFPGPPPARSPLDASERAELNRRLEALAVERTWPELPEVALKEWAGRERSLLEQLQLLAPTGEKR